MKDNCLIIILFIITGISVSCSDSRQTTDEDRKTDTLIATLKEAAYNSPDSVVTVAGNQLKTVTAPLNKSKLYLLIAGSHELLGNYDSSIFFANEGLKLVSGDEALSARLYNQLGIDYDYKGDYRNALDNYHKAQEYFEAVKDTVGYIRERNNIALIYQNTGELATAKSYLAECLRLSREKKYRDEEIMSLSNLASVENEMHDFNPALAHFRQVLQSDLESGNQSYIASSYHNVGECYKNLRQFDSAALYLGKAIALKEQLELKGSLSNSYKQYADMLVETNRLKEGEYYLDKAFALARETGVNDYLKDCFYLQSRLAEKKGDYKTAYIAADSFHTIRDSLSDAKFRSELVIKETNHELATRETLRKAQAKEFENEKLALAMFILFLVVVAASLSSLLTKQRKLNRQLELQKQQIEEGLAQRGHLLSFIAHEIKNPLGGIIGLTDLLLNDKPTPSQKELLEYQKKASSHLLSLMSDVLDYQKLGSGKVELNSIRFSLRDVLYHVYALYQSAIREKSLSYDLDYDNNIPPALIGDPVRLTQVFTNLLNNAIKFTEKGTVSISAKLVSKTASQVSILCTVSDSGVGIPEEEKELIFELYVQSSKNKSAHLGTGLGLGIVKNILALMNSKIELSSFPGDGTTFSFVLNLEVAET